MMATDEHLSVAGLGPLIRRALGLGADGQVIIDGLRYDELIETEQDLPATVVAALHGKDATISVTDFDSQRLAFWTLVAVWRTCDLISQGIHPRLAAYVGAREPRTYDLTHDADNAECEAMLRAGFVVVTTPGGETIDGTPQWVLSECHAGSYEKCGYIFGASADGQPYSALLVGPKTATEPGTHRAPCPGALSKRIKAEFEQV